MQFQTINVLKHMLHIVNWNVIWRDLALLWKSHWLHVSYSNRTLFCSWFDSSDNHQRPTVSHIFPVSGPSYNAALLSGAQPMKQPFIRSPADLAAMAASDFMNSPRRERFVFRPNHLEILDRAFQEDSYPSHERREAISKECNAVTEAIGKWSCLTGFMVVNEIEMDVVHWLIYWVLWSNVV